jgi:hypothetical protein
MTHLPAAFSIICLSSSVNLMESENHPGCFARALNTPLLLFPSGHSRINIVSNFSPGLLIRLTAAMRNIRPTARLNGSMS